MKLIKNYSPLIFVFENSTWIELRMHRHFHFLPLTMAIEIQSRKFWIKAIGAFLRGGFLGSTSQDEQRAMNLVTTWPK